MTWIKNYNQSFTNSDGEESQKYPKVRGFDLSLNIEMWQRYCTLHQLQYHSRIFSNFISSYWTPSQPIWARHGGFQLHNDCTRGTENMILEEMPSQPTRPSIMEVNFQANESITKPDLPPSYDEVMNSN